MSEYFAAIRRAHHRSDAIFKDAVGLSSSQFAVLTAIASEPGLTQTDVVRETGIDRSTVSGIVDRLCGRGWIRRAEGDDARAWHLHLTDEGERVLADARLSAIHAEQAVLNLIGKPMAAINKTLNRIARAGVLA